MVILRGDCNFTGLGFEWFFMLNGGGHIQVLRECISKLMNFKTIKVVTFALKIFNFFLCLVVGLYKNCFHGQQLIL